MFRSLVASMTLARVKWNGGSCCLGKGFVVKALWLGFVVVTVVVVGFVTVIVVVVVVVVVVGCCSLFADCRASVEGMSSVWGCLALRAPGEETTSFL